MPSSPKASGKRKKAGAVAATGIETGIGELLFSARKSVKRKQQIADAFIFSGNPLKDVLPEEIQNVFT